MRTSEPRFRDSVVSLTHSHSSDFAFPFAPPPASLRALTAYTGSLRPACVVDPRRKRTSLFGVCSLL